MNAPLNALGLVSRPLQSLPDLAAAAERAARVAASFADAVDRDGRFPAEALSALRQERLLGILVPAALGGAGAGVSTIVDMCYRLGQACASTAMIYAMHQACVACVVRHGRGSGWHDSLLRRIGCEQLLLASSTTEGQRGGDIRASAAAVTYTPDRIGIDRAASVISYGAHADAILTTARRHGDAAPSDQVLVAFLRADMVLEQTGGWDTLGMRGTCSEGFRLRAQGSPGQVFADPYETIHVQSMVPVSQLAWCGAWAGIAADAVERARTFIRKTARHNNGILPPGAPHYTQARATLQTLCSLVAASARSWERQEDDRNALQSLEFQADMNMMKVQGSALAVSAVMDAVQACGLAGYRNDSAFSLGRHVRDVLSSTIMINNDRIMGNLAAPLLLSAVPASVCI